MAFQKDSTSSKIRIELKMIPQQKQLLRCAAKAMNMSLPAFVLSKSSQAAENLLLEQPHKAQE